VAAVISDYKTPEAIASERASVAFTGAADASCLDRISGAGSPWRFQLPKRERVVSGETASGSVARLGMDDNGVAPAEIQTGVSDIGAASWGHSAGSRFFGSARASPTAESSSEFRGSFSVACLPKTVN